MVEFITPEIKAEALRRREDSLKNITEYERLLRQACSRRVLKDVPRPKRAELFRRASGNIEPERKREREFKRISELPLREEPSEDFKITDVKVKPFLIPNSLGFDKSIFSKSKINRAHRRWFS